MELIEQTEGALVLREGPVVWELELPAPQVAFLALACGVIGCSPDSPARTRALEVLNEGGDAAVTLAATVIASTMQRAAATSAGG